MSRPVTRIFLEGHELPSALAWLVALTLTVRERATAVPRSAGLESKVTGSHDAPGNTDGDEGYRRLLAAVLEQTEHLARRVHGALGSTFELEAIAPLVAERCRMFRCRKRQRPGAHFCDACGAELASEMRRRADERARKQPLDRASAGRFSK